ncbi:MAG TPA: MFS transporter [Candidatus Coprenecus stercoravium]|uniref:MFS transporter n=1 Tax=Candidatus Coprenecus stercoravium TaxID=2840735 RepID=A0A9D2GQP4_9BACT|nr:MFS transporter [Candidatus Coprenecus stercoravium]
MTNGTTTKKNYALPIAIMIALFFMIAFVTGLQNPLGVIVKSQFELSNFQSQLGNLMNFLAYLCMGIPAGMLLQRIGYKKTALAAVTVGFIGVGITFISGTMDSFPVYLAGAFISGFSMCMLNTVVNPMLNTLGGGGNKGNQLIQIGGVFNSTAATLAPVLGGYLIGDLAGARISNADPVLFLAMGIFAVAFIVLFFSRIPEPYVVQKEKSAVKDSHSAWSFRHFKLGILCIFIYVGVEVGIPNIMNLFMTDPVTGQGIDAAIAGSVVGTYWLLMLVGRFIGGVIGAKVSSKSMLTTAAGIGIILMLLAIFMPTSHIVNMPVMRGDLSFGLENVPVNCLFLVLCGLCTSVMWGVIFNLAVEGLGKYTSAASGIFMMMVCGGGILPAVQSAIADSVGFLNSYWLLVAGFVYMLYYALAGSKNVNKDIKTE